MPTTSLHNTHRGTILQQSMCGRSTEKGVSSSPQVSAAADSLFMRARSRPVIPAKAGIHSAEFFAARGCWIPASAGMTESLSGLCLGSQIGTRSCCLFRKTCRHTPAAFTAVELCAILVCHSREGGNPLCRILRRPWLLDSCFRRNDRVSVGILPRFAGRHTSLLSFLEDLPPHSGRTLCRCGRKTVAVREIRGYNHP